MSTEKLQGKIRVGDELDWCYYGHEGWPRCYARLRVMRICAWGDDTLRETEDDHDDDEAGAAIEAVDIKTGVIEWNSLDRIRENCRRVPAGDGGPDATAR